MDELRYTKKDPKLGYITNQLLVPKRLLNQTSVKETLTFYVGEHEYFDENTEQFVRGPKKEELWDETEHHMVLPRAFFSRKMRRQFSEHHGLEWVEERLESKKIEIDDNIVPRDETQVKALKAMAKHRGGTVNLACGKGKSVVALKYWATLREPALIVVNSSALADQWLRRIHFFLNSPVEVGWIQGKRSEWEGRPIVIATIQTLANRRDQWSMAFRRHFGVVFFDEGHHMSAPHFVKAADLFFGQRFSLTATAYRTDGLESISMYHIGRIIYQDLKQELIPTTLFHQLSWQTSDAQYNDSLDVSGSVHARKLYNMLGQVPHRNALILRHLKKDMAEGRHILLLTHSVEHTRALGELAQQHWDSAGVVNGEDVKPFDRIPILEEANPVIATFDLAREALDKDILDTLYVATPFGNQNDQQQAWGRIQRRRPGKNPLRVRVYEDLVVKPPSVLKEQRKRGKKKSSRFIEMPAKQCRTLRVFLRALDYPYKIVIEKDP